MKRLSLLLVMIFAVCLSWAAINDLYTFSATNGTYTPINGTTETTITGEDDAISAGIPIGFDFLYGETTFSQVKISSNGWVGLGTSQTGSNLTNALASTTIQPVIAPLWDDLSAEGGTVSYITEGTAPNRIFTVQYANVLWRYDGTTTFNFQVKIYESGKITMSYGDSTGAPYSASASIGINMSPGGSGWYYSVTPGAAASASTTTENTAIATFPAVGVVYEFTPVVVGANDLAATGITGNATPSIGQVSPYTVSIRNRGTVAQSTYTVKLMNSNNVELATIAGTTIQPGETLPFVLNWTPQATGLVTIIGKVILEGDVNPQNDQTAGLAVSVMETGVTVVQIGTGTTTNTDTGSPAPYGTYWKNFRQQYLYTAAEINAAGGAPGLIGSLAYEVVTLGTCSAMPNYTIRMKSTTETALTTTFETGEYTTVWTNASYLPTTGWNVHVLSTPFVWDGVSNIIVDIVTDMITGNYTRNALTPYSVTNFNSSLRFQSDNDPANAATTGTVSMNRSNVRFYMTISDMGSLSGLVTSSTGPVAEASVQVNNTVFHTITAADGTYSLPFAPIGAQTVTVSKLGFSDLTLPVTVVENQNTVLNFTMATLPQVTVTGTVVGSDQPTVGLADATITLAGYAPYTATTNASGMFTITGVYANNTYNYTVAVAGYQGATGTAVVGATNLNMGTITVNEIALPAAGVVAAVAGNNINVTWIAPDPNAQSFEDGFETYADFAVTMDPWTLVDVDLSTTYGFTGITFPNSGTAMSYIVFNPNTTTPAVTGAETHGGDKYAACFASTTPPNNDWLITPQMSANGVFKFWARSFVADYGLERFKVGVSTTGAAPADFTIISGANYVEAPVEWTEYTYDLAAYAGQQIRVGIQCLSNDAFIFFVDDVMLGTPTPTYLADINTNTISNVDTKLALRSIVEPNYANIQNVATPNRLAVKKDSNSPFSYNNRVMTGYKVYRLIQGQETNESAWVTLTANPISATAFVDDQWTTLNDGWYKWAVKAMYTNGVMAPAAFSNALQRLTQVGTIAGTVRNAANQAIVGATVTTGDITATTNAQGAYSMIVPAGTHTVNASATGYVAGAQNGVVVVTGQTTAVNFILQQSLELLNDGFESYADFSLDMAPWTLVDVDQSTTYGFTGITFPNSGTAMSYIVFNPNTTTPAVTGGETHAGDKYAACFASTTPPNNDWMMTPLLNGGGSITFYARSFVADYGLERFKVGVSTGGTAPANFNIISGANYVEAPVEWTMFTYSLAAYAGQQIRIGIQCLSNDAFIFMVDDVVVMGATANEDNSIPAVTTALNNNYPNPFNPETTISYSVKTASPVTVEIYNVKGQVVKTLVSETKAAGNHTVVWNGKDNNGRSVTSGVYFYKMKAGTYSSTKKMILMK